MEYNDKNEPVIRDERVLTSRGNKIHKTCHWFLKGNILTIVRWNCWLYTAGQTFGVQMSGYRGGWL